MITAIRSYQWTTCPSSLVSLLCVAIKLCALSPPPLPWSLVSRAVKYVSADEVSTLCATSDQAVLSSNSVSPSTSSSCPSLFLYPRYVGRRRHPRRRWLPRAQRQPHCTHTHHASHTHHATDRSHHFPLVVLSLLAASRPMHFREHSNDGKHHWTLQTANNTSLLPSPPYSLTVSYIHAHGHTRPSTAHTTTSFSTARPSTAAASHSATYSANRRLLSIQSHITRSRGVWGATNGSVGEWLREQSADEVIKQSKERRRRRSERPTLAQRSASSIDRIDRHTKQSEREANQLAHKQRLAEQQRKQDEEDERSRRSARRQQQRQEDEKEAESEAAEEEVEVEEELAIPAGFYYAKQYDFFATVRQKAEQQRRERRKLEEKERAAAALGSPQQQARAACSAVEGEQRKQEVGGRSVGWTEEKEQLIARGRKSDWLVDGWWEMKQHIEHATAASDTTSATSAASSLTTAHRHPQPLTSALLYPTTPSPALLRSLFPAHSPTPPPLTYTPLTPLYLSSRADYQQLQHSLLDTFALNTLTKPEASRSALEQQQLDVWVERLPVIGQVDGDGGRELMRVSQVVRRSLGEDVYRAGEIGTCFYVLLQGRLQLAAAAVGGSSDAAGGGMVVAASEGRDEKREKQRDRPSTTEPGPRRFSTSHRGSLAPRSGSVSTSRPTTPSTSLSHRSSLIHVGPTSTSTAASLQPTSPDAAQRSLTRPASASTASRHSSRPATAPTLADGSDVRTLIPYSVFGRRREEADARGGGSGASSSGSTGSTATSSTTGKRGWARVRAVLNVSRAFQMSQIGALADSRTRVDTARCMDETMLLCVMYSEYDRISRQHIDRQSRHVVAVLRTLEPPLSRLRMRQLHRIARALTPVHIAPGQPLLPTVANMTSQLLLLESGSAMCTKGVDVLRYGRAAGVQLQSWQVEERRVRRNLRVAEVSGLSVLGYEAVLGCGVYDGTWRAVSACHGYVLHRHDFHLLMHKSTLDAIAALVHSQRERFKQRIAHTIETDEHATSAANAGAVTQRAMSVHAHVSGSGALSKARHKVSVRPTLSPSPFSTSLHGGGEQRDAHSRLVRRRSSVVDVSHLHGRAKQQLHDTMVVELSFGDFAMLH